MKIRIGNGYDVHKFADAHSSGANNDNSGGSNNYILLGGVKIPSKRNLEAHSDGDVLVHALVDAMLGALALGDIGKHFPDTDPDIADIDSFKILEHVRRLVKDQGWKIINLDTSISAEKPRMAPYISSMREKLAKALELDLDQVSVKATTSEGLGFIGREEGIAVSAVVLLGDRAST